MGARASGWRTGFVALLLLSCGLVAAGSAAVIFGSARETVTDQVQRGEALLAAERGAAVGDALAQAIGAIRIASTQPLFVEPMAAGDVKGVQVAIATGVRRPGIVSLVVVDLPGRTLAAQPPGTPFMATREELDVVGSGSSDSLLQVTLPIRSGAGVMIGRLQAIVSISALAPRAVAPPPLESGIVSVVDRDGRVILTGSATRRDRLQNDELLQAVATAGPSLVSYHSEILGRDRLAAVSPVPGTSWSVIVSADDTVAYQPARALGLRLLTIFLVASTVILVLFLAVASLVRTTQHRLREAHDAAVAQSYLDPLTGVGNRRQLEDVLVALRAQGVRTAVVAVDFDDFKGLNDRWGHMAGDEALRAAAHTMLALTRPIDTVIRLGGDEFMIVLPDTGEEAAAATATRIRDGLEGVVIEGYGPLAVSVGHAAGTADETEDLLRWADRRLYDDKQNRNAASPRLGRD